MKSGDFIICKTIVSGQEVVQVKIQDVSCKIINVDDPTTFTPLAFALLLESLPC